MGEPIVIALDGTSASGRAPTQNASLRRWAMRMSTQVRCTAASPGCLEKDVDLGDAKAIASLCRRWKTELKNDDGHIRLYVDGYFPEKEIRTAETSAAVPVVAAVPAVRKWMKAKQRECIKFGDLVMEGRDIGSNVFPDTVSNSTSTPRSTSAPSVVLPMGWTKIWPNATSRTANAPPPRS